MMRFCVKCGKETNELIGSLCAECFPESNRVIDFPREIVVDLDTRSGKIRFGRSWLENSRDTYAKILMHELERLAKPKKLPIENIAMDFEKHEKFVDARVSLETEVQGVRLPVHFDSALKFRKTISDASMKISSYYHEAVIQVRFLEKPSPAEEKKRLEEVLSGLDEEKRKDELSVAIDVKRERGGHDVYVGSKKAARKVVERLAKKSGSELTYSNKLIGQDSRGKEKYRHTFCIRFPKK